MHIAWVKMSFGIIDWRMKQFLNWFSKEALEKTSTDKNDNSFKISLNIPYQEKNLTAKF